MEDLAIQIVEALKEKRLSIATAESITGGMIAKHLTDIPGSSSVYLGGIVAYSPYAKVHLLNILEEHIEKFGTVSSIVAEEMAVNIKSMLNANIGISTTGIAGPDSIEGKPVGLVYIGIALENRVLSFENHFVGTRSEIRKIVTQAAFIKLLDILKGGK